jgi:hypothetical protein
MTRLIVPALVALLVSGPAWGLLGNDLHKWCNGTASPRSDYIKGFEFGSCSGFVMGVFETNSGVNGGVAGFKFCPPKKPDIQQLIDIVRKWLRDNPEKRHYSAESLVAVAFSEAFPCKK